MHSETQVKKSHAADRGGEEEKRAGRTGDIKGSKPEEFMKQIAETLAADLVELGKELDAFDGFWAVYPRGTNKAKAKVSFNRLSDKDKHNCLIGAKHHSDNNPQWQDPTKIPHATTFINGKRWEDEIVIESKPIDQVQKKQGQSAIDSVWSAFAQMWPTMFVAKYGVKPLPVWRSQVSKLEDKYVMRGIRTACDSGAEFPPSLPTFLRYCAKTFGEETAQPKLPKPECTQEVALNAIAEMRKILR
jgi:hypothetical protein